MAFSNVADEGQMQVEVKRFCTEYTGTADQIVGAGVAQLDQFPGQPGRGKTCATYRDGEPVPMGACVPRDERYVQIRRYGKSKFHVHVGHSQEQEDAYDERIERERQVAQQAEAYRAAKQDAERSLQAMPTSVPDYRAVSVRHLDTIFNAVVAMMQPSAFHGFSFDDRTIGSLKVLADRMRVLIQNGGVVFDAALHQACVRDIHAKAAQFAPTRPALRLVRAQ